MINDFLKIDDFTHTTNIISPVTLSPFAKYTLKRQMYLELDNVRPLILLPMAYEKFTINDVNPGSSDYTTSQTLTFEPIDPDDVLVYYKHVSGTANDGFYSPDSVSGKTVTVTINNCDNNDILYIYYFAYNIPVYLMVEVPQGGSEYKAIIARYDLGKLSTLDFYNRDYQIFLPFDVPLAEDMSIVLATKSSVYVGFVDPTGSALSKANLELPVKISTLEVEEKRRGIVNLKGWVADYLKGL